MNRQRKHISRGKIILIGICCVVVLFVVVWLLAGIEIAISVLMVLGVAAFLGIFAYGVSALAISRFISDCKIYRNGERYAGTCTGTRHYYRSEHLWVEWMENGEQRSGDFHAFRKLRRFPYPVTVYSWEGKANLGLYSLLLDVWFLVLFLPFAVVYIVWIGELVKLFFE